MYPRGDHETRTHGLTRVLILAVGFFLAFPAVARADIGPKPELTIVVKNPPDGEYYLDLLIQGDASYDNIRDKRSQYDQAKLALLEAYNEDGWHAALARGTRVPMWGNLAGTREGDTVVHVFGYVGVPEDYKIALVNPDNRMVVSPEIHRNAYQSRITYDYSTGRIFQRSVTLSYVAQFVETCVPTLLIEGIILLLFGFSLKANWKVFIGVNVGTQVLVTATIGTAMLKGGALVASLSFFPVELLVLAIEVHAFSRLLTQHTRKRRVLFAITANVVSASAGILLIWLGSGLSPGIL